MIKPVVTTSRLTLRQLVVADLPKLVALYTDPVVMQYLPAGTRDRQETEWLLQFHLRHWQQVGFGCFAVEENATGNWLGQAGLLWLHPESDTVELSYTLKQSSWGRGLGSEVAIALTDYALKTLYYRQVTAICHPQNIASLKILAKLGMRYQRDCIVEGMQCQIYAKTSPEFAVLG